MNIFEAYEELKRRYPQESVEASYNINNFSEGVDRITCVVYRSGVGEHFGKGRTWRTAIINLTDKNRPQAIEPCEDGEPLLDHERREDAVRTAADLIRQREGKG